MTKRFEETVDLLLDAINTGELAKGSCQRCAVGNMARHYGAENIAAWWPLFCTGGGIQDKMSITSRVKTNEMFTRAIESIENIPYTEEQLAKIEFAFETNTMIDGCDYSSFTPQYIKADQIKGLTAVVELLKEFDKLEVSTEEVFTSKVVMPC